MTTTRRHRRSITAGLALGVILLLQAGCAGPAATTDTGRGGRGADDAIAIYAGNWSGTFDITMGAGGLSLVLNHDGSVWTGEITLEAEGEMISGSISSFAITEEGCTFQTFIEGADVFFTGVLEEGALAGVLEAYFESDLVADGTFVLTKK
jgi:hypothetical protein